MATKLKITRDQLAKFIEDPDTIKKFEKLFTYVNSIFSPSGNDYFQIEDDGTWVNSGEGTTWDELSNPFVGNNIFEVAGRVDFNYTDLTLDFNTNARYPNEPVGIVTQSIHSRKADSDIYPHIHWMQTSDAMPNILVAYKLFNNGAIPPTTWTLKALKNTKYPYIGSGMQQLTEFNLPEGHGVGHDLSFSIDVKIYRDSANTSGLFDGADTYAGVWSAKYYDIHFEKDMNGSREEYAK